MGGKGRDGSALAEGPGWELHTGAPCSRLGQAREEPTGQPLASPTGGSSQSVAPSLSVSMTFLGPVPFSRAP